MSFIIALFLESSAYLQWPGGWGGWVGIAFYVAGLAYFAWRFRAYAKVWEIREWAILGGLFVAEFLLTLFIGVRLVPGQALPTPGALQTAIGPALMVFAALPWVLAAGLLGTWASMGLAFLSGLLLALFDTHQIFTVFEFTAMGLAMGMAVNQRFRTPFFRILRHPFLVSLGILLVYPGMYVMGVLLGVTGNFLDVLDFALAQLGPVLLQMAVMLLLASVFSEVFAVGIPSLWGRQGKLVPSPGETSLETGAFYVIGPVVFILVIVLGGVGWNAANRAARALLEERMIGAAEISAENVPLAVEVGQGLILQLAEASQASDLSGDALTEWLQENVGTFAYFQDLMIIGPEGNLLGRADGTGSDLTMQEETGVALAQQGIPFQFYVVDLGEESQTANLVFIARIDTTSERGTGRVLLGRTALDENPFALNIIHSLDTVKAFDGEGFLVDERGMMIYHPEPGRIMTFYNGPVGKQAEMVDFTSSTGTRILHYSLPVKGQPWVVVVTVPAQAAQQVALQIAAPLLGLLLILAFVLVIVTRVVMRLVTGSLKTLASEANRIASDKNELATPLQVDGVNELGQMRQAFEQMRVSLKAYLDEREETLLLTQIGEERLSAIIESTPDPVLVTDASNRLILANSVAKQVFGNGKHLDNGIPLEEMITEDTIIKLMERAEDEILTQEITLPDGRVYVAKAKSVITDDNQRMGQVCVLRDVTRFKELDALKSDFVTSVSHDLRSPLTLMRGYATMVEMMGQLNDEQKKYLKRIEHGVDRMGH
ncbi:MAG TPA: histidine kinase dimerization/phospho-acceptor domain-containing protein, partial [Anaerolineales bacterium]|nr:histidine kinase dimerization/phospho-acceptor domain-containing protein [Anaerolineales bacterium]